VERCYPAALMLHAEDLLDIDGVAVSGPRLHAAIEGLQAGVVDKRLRDILYRNGTLPFEPRGGKLSPQQVADHCRAMLAGSNMDFGGGNEEDWPPPAPGSETAASAAARLARPWWRFW
jgi:hypothetical protein